MQSPRSLPESTSSTVELCPPNREPEPAQKSSTPSGPERRIRTRVLTQIPLTVKFGGVYEASAQATNISARGVFFLIKQRLEIGSAIELIFRLPRWVIGVDGVWLRCPAEVVRLEKGLPESKFGVAARIKSYEVLRVS